MGNKQTHQNDQEEMKNNKPSTAVEEDLTDKRKTSASVDEIRDLYSALQELVPSTTLPPSPVPSQERTGTSNIESKENSDGSQCGFTQNLIPLIQPNRMNSPLPSRTQPRVALRRNRSHSLDAQMGFPNFSDQVVRRDSLWGYSQRKRLLKKTKRMHEELHTIIKDFDEAEINGSRRTRSRSLNTLLETTARSSEEQSNPVLVRTRSFTKVCEERPICEIDGRVLERTNQNSEKNELQNNLSENANDLIQNVSFLKKRLSAGDILERQRTRLNDPRSRCRRKSIGGSLLLNAIVSSASTFPTKRRCSLSSALSLIAHKNELQELIKNCQGHFSKEENSKKNSDETVYENTKPETPATKLKPEADSYYLQKEVDVLLTSIKELQQDSENIDMEQQDPCTDFDDTRRASAASVGTEMHNLLEALRELVVSAGNETPSSTPSGSTTSSRRTSVSEIRAGAPKESLDELEAYFKSKLEDISEGNTSSIGRPTSSKEMKKTASNSKANECLASSSRRHSAPKVNDKGKTAKSVVLQSTSTLHSTSNSDIGLLKPSDAFGVQRQTTGQHVRSHEILSRRRSRSAHNIELPETTERMLATETRMNNRSPTNFLSRSTRRQESSGSNASIADLDQAHSRALWKEDQLMFADQVNKRLHDWLERATASVSLQEDHETKMEDHTLKVDNLLVVSSDNEPVDCKNKKSTSRFAMKKVLRKKIRRSKSINNLSETEPEKQHKSPRFKRGNRNKPKRSKSMHSINDHDELQHTKPKSKTHILRSPQNLLRIGRQRLLRAKSFHKTVSMKSSLDSTDRISCESDESFDDGNSTFFVRRNLSCESSEQNQSFDSHDADSDYHEPPRTTSPAQKTDKHSKNVQTPNRTENSSRLFLKGKRISRFPVNLPLFYTPGGDTTTLQTTKHDRCYQHLENRKTLHLSKCERNHGLFYEDKRPPPTLTTSVFPFLVSPVPSNETHLSRPCSVSDEGYIRSPTHEGLIDSPSTSPDFNDHHDEYRDRAKSIESEDSGCPSITNI